MTSTPYPGPADTEPDEDAPATPEQPTRDEDAPGADSNDGGDATGNQDADESA